MTVEDVEPAMWGHGCLIPILVVRLSINHHNQPWIRYWDSVWNPQFKTQTMRKATILVASFIVNFEDVIYTTCEME